jgi:hypothetical protein
LAINLKAIGLILEADGLADHLLALLRHRRKVCFRLHDFLSVPILSISDAGLQFLKVLWLG